MSNIEYIQNALCGFLQCVQEGERVAVPTLCLYPSNTGVVVYVTGGMREVTVSDGGGALDEISSHGLPVAKSENLLRPHCKKNGLKTDGVAIYSPVVPLAAIPAAIALVANASSLAAHEALHKIKNRRRRDLRAALLEVLLGRYSADRIKHGIPIVGKSNKQYKFDTVVEIGGDGRLILDTVLPEASSINARVVSHLDVREMHEPNILQRIVYDDEDDWAASDLRLLQMAAPVVPFPMIKQSLDRVLVQ